MKIHPLFKWFGSKCEEALPMISKDALAIALGSIAKENSISSRWDYDTISNARLAAKIELCEELAAALGLDKRPSYIRARKGE
jgi:hypothetical protein